MRDNDPMEGMALIGTLAVIVVGAPVLVFTTVLIKALI